MNTAKFKHILTPVAAAMLAVVIAAPSSAFLWFGKSSSPSVPELFKNVIIGESVLFSADDFPVQDSGNARLSGITVNTLPDSAAGALAVGTELLTEGAYIESSALSGLQFQSLPDTQVTQTQFTFTPHFSTGESGTETLARLYLLTAPNESPIARNLELSTYKNVAITCYFDAIDNDGDILTFQLSSTPARGSVTLSEDGSSQFVYTPYENKTGKDTFSYVAIDPAGNISAEAKVTICIEKSNTQVTYADMAGNPAQKAAVRLAEEGIFIGQYCNGQYFFHPNEPVSRSEFLAMAMAATGLEPLVDVSSTGFYDDDAIPTWCKGYVSAALKAGTIRGNLDEGGQPIFNPDSMITQAQATVMLDNLLNITNVATEETGSHWAAQSVANLTATGMLRSDATNDVTLATQLTRADVALLLDSALDVLKNRQTSSWFSW